MRYWWVLYKISTNYLSILYIMYSIIHIRYCVIGLFHLPSFSSPLPSPTISNIYYIFNKSPLSPSLPIYLYSPIYICPIFHTILCKYLGHLSPLSIYLSCLIYPSYLSTYLLSNIYYIYNKYPIYLSLPYNLYTHDNICSIFIIDCVII